MAAERTVVDTSVLLAATEPARPGHAAALALLNGEEWLAISPQILREYLSVATRPSGDNGIGLSATDACANVGALVGRCDVLAENVAVVQRLLVLLAPGGVTGRQVHDATIVATALVHGAARVVTDDVGHFARFADLVEIVPLTPEG